ncbi:peptidase S7 [Fuchsiella alkaliacetigena]|uniref:peptidase S7 n=1 Tax=Fuchsiella alkaliacetigena TaxID=957042 RepID=UPI00200AAFBB|nr:peptidase S7 [Fuchsiella alkaliacetigena]MCK8825862.1 peptidase S7 [Fuchsiella alkaliacetigena]
MQVKGIAKSIVDKLVDRTVELSQGRAVGTIGLVNEEGYIDSISPLTDGGVSGLSYRKMLSKVVDVDGRALIEGINQLPDNAVLISTNPGKTGLIVDTNGVNLLDSPVVRIGVKAEELAGVGVVHPESYYFDLATQSEEIQIKRLAAKDMNEEREILRESSELRLNYLEISDELEVIEMAEQEFELEAPAVEDWEIARVKVDSICEELVEELVNKSISVEQGREVAAIGVLEDGHVVKGSEIVVGGMGYVPSRMLASSYTEIDGISLRRAYTEKIPAEVVIVHTHPGGTGVMHMGDAMAGPGMWGRPIIAVGHDKAGQVKGATVIELQDEISKLAEESEQIGQDFYKVDTPEEEANLRKRKFGIAQEYTDLCKSIEIK